MFGLGEKKATAPEDTEVKKSGIWSTQLGQALSDARKKRVSDVEGSQKGSKGGSAKGSGSGVSRELSEAAKAMFDPNAWRAIVRAPFALGKVITGRKCWELEKREEDTLATSTSMTAEYFMAVDPKYVALTICMFNWAVIMTEKYAENAKEARLERQSEPEHKPAEVSGLKPVA